MYSRKALSRRAKKFWAKNRNEMLTSDTLENIQHDSFILYVLAFHMAN